MKTTYDILTSQLDAAQARQREADTLRMAAKTAKDPDALSAAYRAYDAANAEIVETLAAIRALPTQDITITVRAPIGADPQTIVNDATRVLLDHGGFRLPSE